MAGNDALVLRLDGPDAASPGLVARMVFGPDGGTIGSGRDCQWVLSDPQGGVEERHARILFVARRYFIADTSSKGVFVADNPRPLGPGGSVQLGTGDRLRIGPYRIVVEQAPGASAAAPGTPLSEPAPASPAATPGPESLLGPPADSGARLAAPAPRGDADGSTLSDEWEQHLASLLGPAPPPSGGTGAMEGASRDAPTTSLEAQLPQALSGPSPLASGLLVADPAHGPLTALLAGGGASGASAQAPPPSWSGAASPGPPAPTPASPVAEQRPAAPASGGPTPFSGRQETAAGAQRANPRTGGAALVTLRQQEVSPWDISRPEAGPARGLGDGLLRGLGLALPALPEDQMAALGYDLGRTLGALADLLVELSQKETGPAQREGEQAPVDPFTSLPTGLLALSDLLEARRHGGDSIEGGVRASIQRLRQRLDSRREQKRRVFEATLSALQERHALRTALAQLDPQRLAARYELGNSRRRWVKARAWDLFKANYPQIVELALARDRSAGDGSTNLSDDAADTARALSAWPERSR